MPDGLRKMKIVVTGASGFIGSAVAKGLVATDARVIACVSPKGLRGGEKVDRIYNGMLGGPCFWQLLYDEKPDWIVHCAGSASVCASISNPDLDHASNVVLTRNIYACVAASSPRTRIIFMSSAAVYGQPEGLPINESTQCNPISPYGRHKQKCEEIGDWFRDHRGMNITNLRIFSAYGPGLTKQVLWDIYQKSVNGDDVELVGDGAETRDFVYIQDVANLVNHIVNTSHWNQNVLNVASGETVTIRQVAEQFLSELGYRGQLRFSGTIPLGSPRFWSADNTKLSRLELGPSVALEKGLREYVRWIKDAKGAFDSNRILARTG